MKLIVGLGNPGKQYESTRHNAGFKALDILVQKLQLENNWKKEHNSLTLSTQYNNEKVLFVKPQKYMNLSGIAIAELSMYYSIAPEDIIVLYDDFDLPIGTIRIRKSGGTAGHNGLKSIVHHLGTDQFIRVRIGVGNPEDPDFVAKITPRQDYVLMKFSDEEFKSLIPTLSTSADMVVKLLEVGYDQFISKYYKEK